MSTVNGTMQPDRLNQTDRARIELQSTSISRKSGDGSNTNRELMVAPEYVPVEGTLELLKMMLETSKTDRQMKKKLETTADAMATAAEHAQVAALRHKASEALKAGLIEGASTMVSGVITFGAGMDGLSKSMSKTQELAAKLVDTAQVGGAKGAAAFANKSAADAEADAKVEETRASALRRSEGSLKSDIDNLKQHDSKMFDLVREVVAAKERCVSIALQSR